MSQLARQDVAEDLEVPVGVGWEPGVGLDAVFIEHAQGAKVVELGVVPAREAEGVVGVEPAMVGMPAGRGPMGSDFSVVEEGLGHGVDGCCASGHGMRFLRGCCDRYGFGCVGVGIS